MWLKRWYLSSLAWTQTHPRITTLLIIALVGITVIPLGQVSGGQSDMASNDRIILNYHLNDQFRLSEVEADVSTMEAYLYAHKDDFEIDHVYSYFSPNNAFSMLLLKPERRLSVAEIQRNIRANWPSLARSAPQFGWRGGNQGVQVTLTGPSTQRLQQLATAVAPQLSTIEGLTDVRSEAESSQQELQVRVNRESTERLGLSTERIATTLSTALRGAQLRSFRHHPNGELRIQLTYERSFMESIDAIEQLIVGRYKNQLITLHQVADIELVPRIGTIRRYDRQTSLRIGANLDGMSLSEARTAISDVMSTVDLGDGYQWSLDGGFRSFQETSNIMQVNMLLALCLIYLVMAALFESLLLPNAVIGSLLLAICGVFWALWITSTPLDMMAMIGMLILMGIVVNNGIVLVDRINQLRPEVGEIQAVMLAAEQRVRPIMMTVSTTMLGLLPLAFGGAQIGGDGPPYAPMAIAIIGGLVFSTLTSLYFVPHAYRRLLAWHQYWSELVEQSARPRPARAPGKD